MPRKPGTAEGQVDWRSRAAARKGTDMESIKLRRLTAADVTFHVLTEDEECRPSAGDFASGDDAADRALVEELNDRLDRGDVWAWAFVIVVARWNCPEGPLEGVASLGCCSYKDEAEFRADAYFSDMCDMALDDLDAKLLRQARQIAPLLGVTILD